MIDADCVFVKIVENIKMKVASVPPDEPGIGKKALTIATNEDKATILKYMSIVTGIFKTHAQRKGTL